MGRQPSIQPVWLPAVLLLAGFAASTWLITAGQDTLALVVGLTVVAVVITLAVVDPIVTRRRSRATLAAVTPADLAARVDLTRVTALLARGDRRSTRAAAGLVQHAFPRLMRDDALRLVARAVPGVLVRPPGR